MPDDDVVMLTPAMAAEFAPGLAESHGLDANKVARIAYAIDDQVAKAQRAVDGHAPVKRNRYIQLTGTTKSVNRQLETKTRALAGWKSYADVGVMPNGGGSCLVGAVPGLDSSA